MRPLESFLLAYLLNSLWQLPLLLAAATLAARALRLLGPAAAHRLWVTTLVLQVLLPACSLSPQACLAALSPWLHRTPAFGPGRISVTVTATAVHGRLHLPAHLLAATALAYLAITTYFLLRLLWRTHNLVTLRQASTPLPLTGEAAHVWSACARRFHVSDATLAASPGIAGPVTLGLRHRLVLLPQGMLATLPLSDLRTVLAHEFAHMHRHDFARNLLYELLAVPVRYHPLLRLTRQHIVESREILCDHLAAQLTSPAEYARSLLRLASLLLQTAPVQTPHAIGMLDAHIFERRLMTLTETHPPVRTARRVLTLAGCLTLALATCGSALALRVGIAAPESSGNVTAPTHPTNAVKVSGGVMAGQVLTRVPPTYPPDAKKARIQGPVVLHVVVGKDGSIQNLQVLSGPKELQAATLDSVRQWTYKPYLLNGEPVEVETTITVTYSLQP